MAALSMMPCIDITFMSRITVSASASSAPVNADIEESSTTCPPRHSVINPGFIRWPSLLPLLCTLGSIPDAVYRELGPRRQQKIRPPGGGLISLMISRLKHRLPRRRVEIVAGAFLGEIPDRGERVVITRHGHPLGREHVKQLAAVDQREVRDHVGPEPVFRMAREDRRV